LKVIDLHKNEILKTIHLEGLGNLLTLNVAECFISTPMFVQNCTNLRELNLYLNVITTLREKSFIMLEKLETLNLEANTMSEIDPSAFEGLISLITLDLNSNQLKVLHEDTFSHTPRLENLKMQHNSIEALTKETLSHLSNLKTLDLSANRIQHMNFDSLQSLINLDLSHNFITQLPDMIFAKLLNVEKINLSYNRLSVLRLSAFGDKRYSLKELNVKFNSIRAIERNFVSHFPNLIAFETLGSQCSHNRDDLTACYNNFDALDDEDLTTQEITNESSTTSSLNESEFKSKDLFIIMIAIFAIAFFLFALVFYIHELILVRERREAIKRGTVIKNDKTLPNYERF
jgi:Leucine-rich repeat (LRR) protein